MYNILLIGTKVKSSDSVGIKPNRRAWEKQDDVKLEKKDANTSLTPFDSPSRLYYEDLKSMLPQCMILWQVLYSLLIAFSLKLFKNRKNVFILPESSFSQGWWWHITWKVYSWQLWWYWFHFCSVFFNRHWSLILVEVEEEIIYYLDPLFGHVSEEKV